MVHDRIGQEQGNSLIQAVLTEYNLESTTGMPTSTYKKVMERIVEILENCDEPNSEEDPAK